MSPFDLVHVVSVRRGSSATIIDVLSAPLGVAEFEILDTISEVVYPKILHLGERLVTKIKWNHYKFGRSKDFIQYSLPAIWKITWDTGRL